MYTELWVNDGYLKRCGNPGGAFDADDMRHMFDMPNGILIERYDTAEEAGVMFKILTGKKKPSDMDLFDGFNCGFLTELFVEYVNAVRDTKCYWVVSSIEGKPNTIGPFAFETEDEAEDYIETLSSHFRSHGMADRWVIHKQKQGGMRT